MVHLGSVCGPLVGRDPLVGPLLIHQIHLNLRCSSVLTAGPGQAVGSQGQCECLGQGQGSRVSVWVKVFQDQLTFGMVAIETGGELSYWSGDPVR